MLQEIFEGQELTESSLSRLWRKFNEHEAAIITAYRGEYRKSQNQQRNRKLYAALARLGYSVTSVDGGYVEVDDDENSQEVAEHSFVVVNHRDTGGFRESIIKLGIHFDQDSVLLINDGGATLVGTTHRAGADPAFGKEVRFNSTKYNPKDPMFFTRLGNSKIVFENKSKANKYADEFYPVGANSNKMAYLNGNEVLEQIKDIEL